MLNKNKKEDKPLELKSKTPKDLLFASRIRRARKKIGLSQAGIAILLGVNINTVQNYEGGQYPRGEHAISLAKVLECSLDWLLLGKEEKGEDSTAIELTHIGVDESIVSLKKRVAELEKENSLLMKVIEAREESLRDKEENLKAHRQMLEQAQKALSTAEKGAIPPIDVLAFAPSAPLTEQDNK